jgi:acyl carrier protein
MSQPASEIDRVLRTFLARAKKPADDLRSGTDLYSEGVGLDSLEAAELSAILEDEFGTDPFSGGQLPQTIGDIYAFYGAAPVGS